MPIDALNRLITPQALAGAALLIFLAGLSEGVGAQGVVLLINRISPLRFALGLAVSAGLFLLSAALWVGGLWLAFAAVFEVGVPLGAFFIAVSAAYAPLLLGALSLIPLVGIPIRWLLRLWSFGVAVAAIAAVTGLGIAQAVAGALLGTLLVEAARWPVGEAAEPLRERLAAAITGKPRLIRRHELPQVIPGYEPAEAER